MRNLFTCTAILAFFLVAVPTLAKEDANKSFSVATWNVQVGSDDLMNDNGWRKRKFALAAALKEAAPDILCTQEGLLDQLKYIDDALPKYGRVGVGRDDGNERGEFCAIYFRKDRFEMLKTETFWLSDTPDTSKNTWDGIYKRICTHARFHDRVSRKNFCVYSTHFPLNIFAQTKSAALIAKRISARCGHDPVILAGDFNSEPNSSPWRVFQRAGLHASDTTKQKTYHINGKALLCIDSIFVTPSITTEHYRVLNQKVADVFPSDHFGSIVDVSISKQSFK